MRSKETILEHSSAIAKHPHTDPGVSTDEIAERLHLVLEALLDVRELLDKNKGR